MDNGLSSVEQGSTYLYQNNKVNIQSRLDNDMF